MRSTTRRLLAGMAVTAAVSAVGAPALAGSHHSGGVVPSGRARPAATAPSSRVEIGTAAMWVKAPDGTVIRVR